MSDLEPYNNIVFLKKLKAKRKKFGIKTLKCSLSAIKYKHYRRPYSKFLYELEEYFRFNWSNDERKFYITRSMRQFNLTRKRRGWPAVGYSQYKSCW